MIYPPSNTKKERERSFDQKLSVRIKSAHPLNLDREKLMQENINLKNQLNKMNTEKINAKREITNLENELLQKEKIIENMINESQMNTNTFAKASEMNLVINVKRQYKDLKKEYEKNIQTLEQAKKDIKNIRLNDLITENKNLSSKIEKFKNMYYANEEQKNKMIKNVQDINIMKQALSKQDEMLLSFQENCQKMEMEILNLNGEIDKLQTQKNKKEDVYNKLKKKLKLQKQLNEKLKLIRDNIQNTEIFCIMKNEYEQKLQKLRKDLAYYRDSNTKNEQLVKEAEKFRQKRLVEEQKQEDIGFIPRKIQASNPSPISENDNMSEEDAKKKISMLQKMIFNQIKKLKDLEDEKNEKLNLKIDKKYKEIKDKKYKEWLDRKNREFRKQKQQKMEEEIKKEEMKKETDALREEKMNEWFKQQAKKMEKEIYEHQEEERIKKEQERQKDEEKKKKKIESKERFREWKERKDLEMKERKKEKMLEEMEKKSKSKHSTSHWMNNKGK